MYLLGPNRLSNNTWICANEQLDRAGNPRYPEPEIAPAATNLVLPHESTMWEMDNRWYQLRSRRIWIDLSEIGEVVTTGTIIGLMSTTASQTAKWRVRTYQRGSTHNWPVNLAVSDEANVIRNSDHIIVRDGYNGWIYDPAQLNMPFNTVVRMQWTEVPPYYSYKSQCLYRNGDAWCYAHDWAEDDMVIASGYNLRLDGYHWYGELSDTGWRPMIGPLGADAPLASAGYLPDHLLPARRNAFIRITEDDPGSLICIDFDEPVGGRWLYMADAVRLEDMQSSRTSVRRLDDVGAGAQGRRRTIVGERLRTLRVNSGSISNAGASTLNAMLEHHDGSGDNPFVTAYLGPDHAQNQRLSGFWTTSPTQIDKPTHSTNSLNFDLTEWH